MIKPRTKWEQQRERIYYREPLGNPPCDGRVPDRFREDSATLRERLFELTRFPCDLPKGHNGRHQHNWCGCPLWDFSVERCLCENMKCGCW